MNAQFFPLQARDSELKVLHGTFVGAGAAAPTVVGGIVKSLTRSGAGVLVVTLKDDIIFPSWKMVKVVPIGTTVLEAAVTAWSATARTISLTLKVGATATDAATADTVYIELTAKNSGV